MYRATPSAPEFETIHGAFDGLATPVRIEASLKLLPAEAQNALIDGGNRVQYGNRGPLAGDGAAMISREEQQRQIVGATLDLVNRLQTKLR